MGTYTVIWEYRGGTYIKQVTGRTVRSAFKSWSHSFSPKEVPGLGPQRLSRFIKEISEDSAGLFLPVLLEGLSNAWCTGTPYGGLVNIIKTDLSP